MQTIGDRVEIAKKHLGLGYKTLIDDEDIITSDALRLNIKRNSEKLETFLVPLIAKKHNISEHWLLTGEGDMQLFNNNKELQHSQEALHGDLFKPVPFYNLNVSAGDVTFLDGGLIKGQNPDDFMYIPIQVDADIAFPTFGHSMYPEISNGDRVAYKFIKDWSFFNYGMKYLIITDEQRMVKYLKKHPKEGYVLLESRNEDYEPIDMPVSSIRSILQVRYIGKIEM